MTFFGFTLLALNALWTNKGRNLLTMSGVTIGVFALTLIVALGQGLNSVIKETVASDANLRQIRLMAGSGVDKSDSSNEIEIAGDMPEDRKLRLRRSAINRRRGGGRVTSGRRVSVLTDQVLNDLSQLEHVESIQPIVTERYRLAADGHEVKSVVSFGVDVNRDRYRDRVMSGSYFSSNDADEVILHEYLLYKWGLVSKQQQESLLGKTVTLSTIENGSSFGFPMQFTPNMSELAGDLSPEEQEALKKLLPKIMERFGDAKKDRPPASKDFKVVGILREFQTGEAFNMVEDTSSAQADVYLPFQVAHDFFLTASVNNELGYASAVVVIDDPKNVPEVEQILKDRGYTAFSVVSVLQQIETTLTVVTVMVAFLTGIAMLVSTLGIINTMITSVLERTREIGIYKAVGASDFQVMSMFLMESGLIGLIGGLVGLGIAALATLPGNKIAAYLIANQMALSFEGTVFVMPLWLVVGGPLLGTLTAVLAAFVPARHAARIDPVKALRHD